MDWWSKLSLRWKLQIGFLTVTAITTLFNRFLAAHELQKIIDLAVDKKVAQEVVALMVAQRDNFIFNSVWESAIEFSLQFMIIGLVATIFLKPLMALIRALRKVEKGDLTQIVEAKNQDEIGQLSGHFNSMVMRLNFVLANAGAGSRHMRQSAYQITDVNKSIGKQAEEEKNKFTEVSQVIIELHKISEEIQHLADDSKVTAHKGEQAALNGKEVMQRSVEDMVGIIEQVATASTQVGELGDTAQNILAIIGTISEIADQTNLLALNAAIEAARAGEQGRGFAVVADEVRSLAEKTSQSSDEINLIIKSLNGNVSQVTSSMQQVRERVEGNAQMAREAAQEIEVATKEIILSVQNAEKIDDISSQQLSRFTLLEDAMTGLLSALQQNSSKVANTGNIAQSLLKLTETLHELIAEFKIDHSVIHENHEQEDERRSHQRKESQFLVRLNVADNWEDAYCENISQKGMKILSSHELPDDQDMKILLMIPKQNLEQYRAQAPIAIDAHIRRQNSHEEGFSYGVEFLNLDNKARKQIDVALEFLSGAVSAEHA